MNLYLVKPMEFTGDEDINGMVVVAPDTNTALLTHPHIDEDGNTFEWHTETHSEQGLWVDEAGRTDVFHGCAWPAPDRLLCVLLGVAADGMEEGIVLVDRD